MMGADHGIAMDYINLLISVRDYDGALRICRALAPDTTEKDIAIRVIECRLLSDLGNREQAKSCYEELIRSAIGTTGTDATLKDILPLYREFLLTYYPKDETIRTFTIGCLTRGQPGLPLRDRQSLRTARGYYRGPRVVLPGIPERFPGRRPRICKIPCPSQ